jgi:aryl-alcohol dehydrogenase-like predicted oxidoreductase
MSSIKGPLLGLGAVQFGMPYGLSNTQHRVEDDEVGRILNAAWINGVDLIDTAPAYGDSEKVIGRRIPPGARFSIVTKMLPLRADNIDAGDVARVVAQFRASLASLRVDRVDALLVHEARDLLVSGGGLLFSALQTLRNQGTVGRLGVSVYDPHVLEQVRARYPIEVVQLPLNVLDQRFAKDGCIASLARDGIEVHIRSVFLQGLLLSPAGEIPARLASASGAVTRFHDASRTAGLEPAAAALAFAMRQPGVSRVVIGVDSLAMFEANARAWATARNWGGTIDFDRLAVDDRMVTDPRCWGN